MNKLSRSSAETVQGEGRRELRGSAESSGCPLRSSSGFSTIKVQVSNFMFLNFLLLEMEIMTGHPFSECLKVG